MFPIGDTDVREAGPGLWTVILVLLNVGVFAVQITLLRPGLTEFFNRYGVVPSRLVEGEQLYSVFTSMFIHGGWVHLITNMLFLWVFGDNVEAALGRIVYPLFYLGGGVAAMAAHVLVNPGSDLPSVGASGAIGALLGAYIVMFPRAQVKVLLLLGFFVVVRRITAVVFLGVWFAMQFLTGLASLGVETAEAGGVAVWAHIGGFLFGVVIGFLFRDRAKDLTLEYERQHRRRGMV